MTGAGTCFTIFLDLHSSARPAYATFVESVASGMPPHGCRVRLSAYGACAIGAASKLLLGRYVTTGDELRRQWQSFAKAPISVPIKRLDRMIRKRVQGVLDFWFLRAIGRPPYFCPL